MSKKCSTTSMPKTLLVLCEGQTEYNYYNRYRQLQKFNFTLKPVDTHGGGYSKMLEALKRSSSQGVLARVAIIDFDRYHTIVAEQEVFGRICDYIHAQNKRNLPVFLIVSNPDFDEFVLLHDETYKLKGNRNVALKNNGYASTSELKADDKVYEKFNNTKNNLGNALGRLNRNTPVRNDFKYVDSKKDFKNTLVVFSNNFNVATSNIDDLYNLIKHLS